MKAKLKKTGSVECIPMMVKRDSLKPSKWNPEIRIQIRYLKDLRESMEQDGFWEYCPIIVDRSGTIIDGHRRWTVAKLLNIEEVPVTMIDDDADRIWAVFNGTHMNLSGQQAMQAVATGLKKRPPKYAALISRIEDLVGLDGLKSLGGRGISPYIINQVRRIGRYCLLEEDREFMSLALNWLVNNRDMNAVVTRAIREDVDPGVIERAVRGNKELKSEYR